MPKLMRSGGMPCKTRTPSQGRKLDRYSRLSEAQADGQEQARWLCRMAGRERRFRAGLVQPRKMGWGGLDWLESYLAAAIGLDSPCSLTKSRRNMGWTMIRS